MTRTRMIFGLPIDIQMAIRLRAVKNNANTGEVVEQAIREVFPADVDDARKILEERKGGDVD